MWKFTIKQDGLKVASGFAEDKEDCIGEGFHYLCLYAEETFKKMTMEIKEIDLVGTSVSLAKEEE